MAGEANKEVLLLTYRKTYLKTKRGIERDCIKPEATEMPRINRPQSH